MEALDDSHSSHPNGGGFPAFAFRVRTRSALGCPYIIADLAHFCKHDSAIPAQAIAGYSPPRC